MFSRLLRRTRFLRRRRERRLRLHSAVAPGPAHAPITMDTASSSRTLLLAFGGLNRQIGIPPFEFLSLTGGIPVKRMFVRDVHQAWYHRGMPGHGENIEGVAESLRGLIAEHDVERLVVAGNSAGGYAALLFGTLLEADTVLCFSPQSTLDLDELAQMGDSRWDDHLMPLTADGALDRRWIHLGSALPQARRPQARTRYRVFFDHSLQVDRLHAERLAGLDGMRLYRFGHGGHYLVRMLRDSGALEHILQSALRVQGDSAGPLT